MIPKEVVDDLLNNADIVSIIGERIHLSGKGRNYWGICPFHKDSNPSLSVSIDKKIYKCFSCQVSGNVVDFVKNFDNINFQAAIQKIADSTGFDLSKYKNNIDFKKDSLEQKIYKINEKALNFFISGLLQKEGEIARIYLEKRKINVEQIKNFEIGYSSKKNNLVDKLISDGFTHKEIIDSGLAKYDENKNELILIFNDRLIFPIRNENNDVIGFSGRKIESNSERPKYLNTKETVVFSKRKIVYNYLKAAKTARINKFLIVLEGYMDVISLNSIGIDNVVALMGTTLSDYHIKLFKEIKDCEIKMFLDGDDPGIAANIKASAILLNSKIKTSIVHNITNKDPDELINEGKKDFVKEIIEKSINPLEYVIEQTWKKTDANNFESLTNFIELVSEFVIKTNNQIIYDKSFEKIEKLTKLSKESIVNIFKQKAKNINSEIVVERDKKTNNKIVNIYADPIKTIETYKKSQLKSQLAIVEDLFKSRTNIDYIADMVYKVPIDKDYMQLIKNTIAIYKNNLNIDSNQLISELKNQNSPDLKLLIEKIIDSLSFKTEYKNPKKRLDDAFDKLLEINNEQEIKKFSEMLENKNNSDQDIIKINKLIEEKLKKRNKFKTKFSNKDRR